jgi:HAD superfamily hydrolase (TIGR01484 family)
MNSIKTIKEIPENFCKNLKYFFTDIDDTITENGKIPPSTMQAIWDLHNAGINVVPVTGRPAGWCDHITRMWPVAGVVGENGAFYFSYDEKKRRVIRKYAQTDELRQKGQKKLLKIKERALKEVSGCAIASDQAFRIADLAIDFTEDVGPLKEDDIEKICTIAEQEGATYKVSSIHVNCWYGDYDKLSCFNLFLEDFTGKTLEQMQDYIIFSGDSLNDEPMFAKLKYSIAVANIKKFISKLKYPPLYITENKSAKGFFEATEIILGKRKNK